MPRPKNWLGPPRAGEPSTGSQRSRRNPIPDYPKAMFQTAIEKAQGYTLPVVISSRRQDGSTSSVVGTFIVLNKDGWMLTAWHIVDVIIKIEQEKNLYKVYQSELESIKADSTTTKAQKKSKLRSLAKPPKNPITNFSPWWGRDGWRVTSFINNQQADLAVGKIEGFDSACVANYPEFKNPSVDFRIGENLCKLGFPFHNIEPTFDGTTKIFQLPQGTLPIPLFPIEGIFTRAIILGNGVASAEFVETSSPGLRGQSGGPTLDAQGRIWAMQSRTIHHPLGFSPKVPNQPNREHQFLNAGMGTHVKSIIKLLTDANIEFSLSTD